MNDRFKFRYFYKPLKVMCEFKEKDYLYEFAEKENYVLMQCTGLKDKNGKLIYEGDILKQPDGVIDYVYWSDGCYIHNGTAITNYDICYQGDTWAKEVNTHEVIGNIYENKELLESED